MFDPYTDADKPSRIVRKSYLMLAPQRPRLPSMYSRVLFALLIAFVIAFHALVLYGLVSCVKGG